MEQEVIFKFDGGTVTLPSQLLNSREDGGHLLVNPPRAVWERSELSAVELTLWSFLVAATGRAMLDTLPQLSGGCINYWEAGNWALHHNAAPPGPKDPRTHRRVHLHVLGRNPLSRHPDWQWGESPRFPDHANAKKWATAFTRLDNAECSAVTRRIGELLTQKYGVARSW